MVIDREAIFEALMALLRTECGATFKTYSRIWKSAWDDPAGRLADLPMLISWENIEDFEWGNRGIGPIRTLGLTLELYDKIPTGQTLGVPNKRDNGGSSVLNPLIDAIDNALSPEGPDGVNTLGGLVVDCRIEGQIVKVLGDEDPSGLCGALIPIKLLVP